MSLREKTKNEEHLSAARRMLTSLPDVESDSDPFSDGQTAGSARSSGSFLPLSDSGDDDPELAHYSGQYLQAKAPNRPPGPGHWDGAVPQTDRRAHAGHENQILSLNQPGRGPISPALHQPSSKNAGSQRKGLRKEKREIEARVLSSTLQSQAQDLNDHRPCRSSRHFQGSDEGADRLSHALAAAAIHESAGDETSGRGSMSSQECKRNSGGNSSRIDKWKNEAILEGMRLVEQERQVSEAQHQLLRKRIEFLTEELELTRSELNMKVRECDELMEVAEELDRELSRDGEEVVDKAKAQTWLEKLQENLLLSTKNLEASKKEKEDASAGPARVCAVPAMWKLDMGLEMPAWFNPFSPQSSSPAALEGVQTPSKHATPKKDAGRSHQSQEKKEKLGGSGSPDRGKWPTRNPNLV